MNKKYLFSLILFSCLYFTTYAQRGLQFYSGISNATNNDKLITPEGLSHSGYHFGADARLIDGNMYFMLGGQYHKVAFIAQEDKSYFSVENSMTWLKLRTGLGFKVFDIKDKIVFRSKALVSFNFISGVPTDIPAPYQNYNAGTVGAVVGLGADVFNFTIDVEFEKGFFKAVNMVSGTEFNFFTFSIGYKI